jgi:hypothetical protein
MKTASLFTALFLALSASVLAQSNNNNRYNDVIRRRSNNNGKQGSGNGDNASAANSTATAFGSASNAADAATSNSDDPQTSLTLAPQVIATGFENNGQDVPTAGQIASLTSPNNFINFCLTVPNLPITNGKQIKTGSCNPAPMGVIPSTDNMPSCKFIFPQNGDTSLAANTAFTIKMAIQNLQSGAFVNAQENYLAAPQQVNAGGDIIGHSHFVVQALVALNQITPPDSNDFTFFKGVDTAAVNGVLSVEVTAGLPAGFYKLSSINTAANHQPVLVPIAQHGSLDDVVYFTVGGASTADASPTASSAPDATSTAAPNSTQSAATAATSPAKNGKQGKRFNARALY